MHSINSPSDLSNAIKYTVIPPALFLLSTTCGKLSALIFLVRLMGVAAEKWHFVILWAVCGIMVILNILGVIVTIGYCHPVAKQWDPSLEGWCMSAQFQYETISPIPYRRQLLLTLFTD